MADYDYGQLIDDFELGVDVMPDEDLTAYIERRRREFESKADGGSIGIEVLFTDKMANGVRVPAVSGGFLKLLAEGTAKGKKGIMELVESGKGRFDEFVETMNQSKKPSELIDESIQVTKEMRDGPITIKMLEDMNPDTVKKLLRSEEIGLYGSQRPEALIAADMIKRFTKADGTIDYERAEIILNRKLKGNESLDELLEIEFTTRPDKIPDEGLADGGRVGLFMGGDPLTGQALSIYNSMNAYGFSDQEIADALSDQGLYTAGDSTPVVEEGIINAAPNIINQGGGDGPPGPAPTGTKTYGKTFTGMTMPDGTPIGSSGVVEGPGIIDGLKNAATGLFDLYSKFSPIGIFSNFMKQRAEKQQEIQDNAIDKARKEREMQEAIAEAERKERERAAQYGATNYGRGADGQQSYSGDAVGAPGLGFGVGATTGGPVSNRTGRGRQDYSKGGLATMFVEKR